jgi:hypothetical protein
MPRTTSRGLYVWDLEGDNFNHDQLAANWDLVDSLLGSAAQSVQVLSAVPGSGNFAGRLVMLSVADSGFSAWQMIRYDGSAWRPVGYEILPTVPVSGNFAGRLVVLSATSGSFAAWSVIRYDGSTWDIVGGWQAVNTGGLATNIQGLQTAKDVYINDSARGFVQVDRVTGTKYRRYFSNGVEYTEVVT